MNDSVQIHPALMEKKLTSRLHPEAARVQHLIAEMDKELVLPLTVLQMRELVAKRTKTLAMPAPPVGRIVNLPGIGPLKTPVRIYYPGLPGEAACPVVLYFHGGGFVVGDLDMVETICCAICREAQVAVVSVDYRLAPESRFPAAVEDAIAACRWLVAEGSSLALDPARIAVAGDSAGANLAAVVAQHFPGERSRLKFQVLVYPVLDLTMSHRSYIDHAVGYTLTSEKMRWYAGHYLPENASATDEKASPLLAAKFDRLPPSLVMVAELDPLADEGEAYAAKLKLAGIPVELVKMLGYPHGFLGWTRESEAARKALSLIAQRLRLAFADTRNQLPGP